MPRSVLLGVGIPRRHSIRGDNHLESSQGGPAAGVEHGAFGRRPNDDHRLNSPVAECETKESKVDRIETRMELEGDLTDEQYTRLLEISERCPIKKTLNSEIVIVAK